MHRIARTACALIVTMLMAVALAFPTTAVRAGTLTVQNCNTGGAGSLADRIGAAQSGDLILFAVDCPSASPIVIAGRIEIARGLTINGTGHVIVVSGGNTSGLFAVDIGVTFTLNRLTLSNGRDVMYGGGAITSNRGILSVRDCTFSNNHADADYAGGGAISLLGGTTTISGSTFVGNTANGVQTSGGAIAAGGTPTNHGSLTVSNSTFSGNTANGSFSGGGGIENTYTTLNVTNTTFSGNAAGGGGGIFNNSSGSGAVANVANTIIAGNAATDAGSGNSGPDALGTFTSGGHNLIGKKDDSAGFIGAGDLTGTIASPLPAHLGPPATNGGLTQTMALLAGSPAIGHGDTAKCAAPPVGGKDQRGLARQARVCSIGAFEAQPGVPSGLPAVKPSGPVGSAPNGLPVRSPPGPALGAPNPLPPPRP